jgi:hypothetical protein
MLRRLAALTLTLTLAGCSASQEAPVLPPDTTGVTTTQPGVPRPTAFTTAIEAAKAADRAVRALAQADGETTPRNPDLLERLAADGTFTAFGAGRELVVWGLSPDRTPVRIWDRTNAPEPDLAAVQAYVRFDVPGASACLRLGVDPDRHIENAPAIDGELAEDPKASAVVAVTADDSACAGFWQLP